MNKFMKMAIKEAEKGITLNHGGPFGAVIVKDGKVVAKGHNQVLKNQDPTCHGEIMAIHKACKKLNNWRLLDCTLYVTVEPCLMCCGAIIQSRIKKVVYGTSNEYYGAVESIDNTLKKYNIEVENNILQNECSNIMKEFFKKRR